MIPYLSKQLKSNELIDRLNACTVSPRLDEMELKRIELEAKKLTEHGHAAASGYFILGAIAAIRLNRAEVDRCFKLAIQLADAPNLPVFRLNYVMAAQRTYGLREAADMSAQLAYDYPDDIEILKQAIDCADGACRFETGKRLRERLSSLGVTYRKEGYISNVDALLSRMAAYNATGDDLLRRIETAGELLRAHKLRYMGAQLFVSDSGESVFNFNLFLTPNVAADLNFEIAEMLATKYDDPMETVLTIGVVPYEIKEAH